MDPRIALTFDDGPSQWTPAILDLLAAAGARATFFVLGQAIDGREDLLRRIASEDHELGNHGAPDTGFACQALARGRRIRVSPARHSPEGAGLVAGAVGRVPSATLRWVT